MLYLCFCSFFLFMPAISVTLDSITRTKSLKDGDTLVSASEIFELGFFTPNGSSREEHRYLGIWYKQASTRDIVWVANRETPIKDPYGVLNISVEGNLLLLDGKNRVVWSWNASRPATNPILQLLSSGNLVLTDGNYSTENEERFMWQSFDYPFDTLLAGMKVGKNFLTGKEWILSSWKNKKDPSSGRFSLLIDVHGFPQVVLKEGNASRFRLGSWNGYTFSGTPGLSQTYNLFRYEFTMSDEQVTYSWEPKSGLTSRLVVTQSGFLERFVWIQTRRSWLSIFRAPLDLCDHYSTCGAHAICKINKLPSLCSCLDGFEPKSPGKWNALKWSDGCVRKIRLECGRNYEFRKYGGLKIPDTSGSLYDSRMNLADCKQKCSRNCTCIAYANSETTNGGSGCLLWFDDLKDMKEFSEGGQDVYIRMAVAKPDLGTKNETRTKDVGIIVGSVLLLALVMAGLVICARRKIKRKRGNTLRNEIGEDDGDVELPIFDLSTISKATDDFSDSNFLGKGGFGPVHKGVLSDGLEIAVKRLSVNSGQGAQEFKNEVKLIAKLQHRNLVRLLGCCIQGAERMLIYEYMRNNSLDFFIFDEIKRKILDWPRRMNIIGGIARGLLYLHQDSRLRIIHRDLKASNVLLDDDMNPKISDFGLARSFWGDQIEADTNKVVGTYGYMSPEYAIDGRFSIKSDVFSFGVLVLEIVAGKKNRGFRHTGHYLNLLGHAWKLWNEERAMELIDEVLGESCVPSEVLRCVHVGLLCVQQKPEDRPNMANVVLMLGGEGSLVQPKQPGFFIGRNLPEAESSSSVPSESLNEVSLTQITGR